MEKAKDGEGNLDGEEDGDDDDQHHGRRVGVPLSPVPTLFRETKDRHPPDAERGV